MPINRRKRKNEDDRSNRAFYLLEARRLANAAVKASCSGQTDHAMRLLTKAHERANWPATDRERRIATSAVDRLGRKVYQVHYAMESGKTRSEIPACQRKFVSRFPRGIA